MPRAPMSEPCAMAWQTSAPCLGGVAELVDHRLEGQGHVRAGVAVGDRIDVEPVELLLVGPERVPEPGETGEHGAVERGRDRHASAIASARIVPADAGPARLARRRAATLLVRPARCVRAVEQ